MEMKVGRWSLLAIEAVLVVGAITITAHHGATVQAASVSCSAPMSPSNAYSTGMPAIPVPHSASGATTSSGTPSLTVQDVRNYVLAQKGVFRGGIVGSPNIASIKLMTLCQVAAFLKQPHITLSTSILYFVVVLNNQGNFAAPYGTTNLTRDVYEVFDAYTGNLMLVGGQR
jgi:hypothetical protein